MQAELEQQILRKLDKIEQNVEQIKEYMVDRDMVLTEEERKRLDESFKHEKEGTLISLEELKDARNKTG